MRSAVCPGQVRHTSQAAASLPPPLPARPRTIAPASRAALAARRMLGLLPLVERRSTQSPLRASAVIQREKMTSKP